MPVRVHTVSITPDARKNVRKIVGRQNFFLIFFKNQAQIFRFCREKNGYLSLNSLLFSAYRQQGWISKTRGELGHDFPLSQFTLLVPIQPIDGINF